MRRFSIKFLLFVGLFLIVILMSAIMQISNASRFSWQIPKQKHVLFMGASHLVYAINDSLTSSCLNVASPSERYLYTYIKLKRLLKENVQIDTIFFQFAPTDIWPDADAKYFDANEQNWFLKNYWPFFEKEEWVVLKKNPIQSIEILFTGFVEFRRFRDMKLSMLGGYQASNERLDSLTQTTTFIRDSGCGNNINFHYLREIISLCMVNNIKIYFLYCPMKYPERFYNQEYYYNSYASNFSDIELLDYSCWNIADDEMMDCNHLNSKGAKRFTTELINRFRLSND